MSIAVGSEANTDGGTDVQEGKIKHLDIKGKI